MFHVLDITCGSTTVKLALFEGTAPRAGRDVALPGHDAPPAVRAAVVAAARDFLAEAGGALHDLDAIAARGGLLRPLAGGTYRVNEAMVRDLAEARYGRHASNYSALAADELAREAGIAAYVVDPVTVDELADEAALTGIPSIRRRSIFHALSQKAAARRAAAQLGKRYEDASLIVAHLGGGISVSPLDHGKFVDVNNANEGGPFSPERAGGVPCGDLVKLCFSGKSTKDEITKRLTRTGGLSAYLGTNSAKQVEDRVKAGDARATEVLQAMCYQIAKEIGNCATVLCGKVDAIVVTGGVAHDAIAMDWIKQRVGFISQNYLVFPGEDELPALAAGALRVLSGEEKAKEY